MPPGPGWVVGISMVRVQTGAAHNTTGMYRREVDSSRRLQGHLLRSVPWKELCSHVLGATCRS